MAPLGSSDNPKSRFRNGSCSKSGPPKPASGFGFDVPPHMQRLGLSSASLHEDAGFQIEQQARQHYFQGRQQAAQNGSSPPATESCGVGENTDKMVTELPKQDPQLGQALQSFMQERMSGCSAPSLMRYNSAPSSMLAGLTSMDTELGQYLSNSNMLSESKKPIHPSHESPHCIENRGAAGAVTSGAQVDQRNGLLSSYGPYHRAFDSNNGGVLSQMTMDVEGARLVRLHEGLQDAGGSAVDLPPSTYHFKGAFAADSARLENGSGAALRMDASKNGLLRHSSSPAGFLSQSNDENEGLMLGSSSGNSSEEGSYERQGSQGYFGNFSWDEAAMVSPNESFAVRKRLRDLQEKGYSQKGDGLEQEQSVLASYFGMQAARSPESAYLTERLSLDALPCRTRAKRGCATHPRSIAERVRRTKISERMKKLQELVPNMDKQTNTAEMLDEAVEYVKYLQRQVQELTESRSKCECSCGKQQEDTPSK